MLTLVLLGQLACPTTADWTSATLALPSVSAELAAVPEPPSRLAWLSGGALGGAALVAALVLVVR